MFDWLADPNAWAALATLTLMEIVLGIDNIVFISILVDRLPAAQRTMGRNLGLGLALVTRLGLLFSLSWLMGLQDALFHLPWPEFLHEMSGAHREADGNGKIGISGKDLILLIGGLFLIYKATHEIHHKLEDGNGKPDAARAGAATLGAVIAQIALIDIVFSLDSVITAVGMARELAVMSIAIVLAVMVMLVAAGPISGFVTRHPTVKVLALSFLILIGTALVADGLHFHIPKGYIYFAMAFSLLVEIVNLKVRGSGGKTAEPHGSSPESE
jgi:predicted tellurium resistance membrane protein TerC